MKKFLVLVLLIGFAQNSLALELPDSQEAAIEVILKNGKIVWVHGSHRGAFVTKDGKAANPGVYASKDGELKFKVDHLGHLTHHLYIKHTGQETVETNADFDYSDEEDDEIDEILG